ncbi:MAG: M20/M25/M40 family metallo-hydrolase [Vicinamibacterales bacterium]|nr:M20/M25/M40 family metallo-hydrolase [Vicinamibacterales bacterium]
MDPVIALLRDLVAIDSVNPSLVPGGAGEAAIADRIAAALGAAGLDVEVSEVGPGRPNVVGVLEGRAPGRALMLCGHTDTVGVEGMAAPFDPVERAGRLYGRGAQDMKSGVAAMVDAAARLGAAGGLSAGRLVVAAVADEEHASLGADALVRGHGADGAVVTEPTGLAIATGHKGFEWVEVETLGLSAHGSRPAEGRDAILHMGRVLTRLESINARLITGPAHPLLGTPSLHASTIGGGRELSVYPDRCCLRFERRTLTGEPADVGLMEVQQALDELREEDAAFEGSARRLFSRPAYEIEHDHPVCLVLAEVVGRQGRDSTPTGMSYWTDASVLGRAGTASVLFGPSGAGLHGTEEYVEIDSVLTCRDTLVDLARAFC